MDAAESIDGVVMRREIPNGARAGELRNSGTRPLWARASGSDPDVAVPGSRGDRRVLGGRRQSADGEDDLEDYL